MVTGKERVLAAYGEGSPENIPSVLCYAHLALWRGPHFWNSFAESKPWWIKEVWDISKLLACMYGRAFNLKLSKTF